MIPKIETICRTRLNNSFIQEIKKDFERSKYIYLLTVPVIIYYILFHYIPMYGVIIAFKDFNPSLGILGSPWVGLQNFHNFINSYHFMRVIRNTLLLNIYGLLWGFPAPIILALLINEIQNTLFKRTVQTVAYLPHFISIIVIAGILINFTNTNGLINNIIVLFGGTPRNLLSESSLFRTIYISSGIWQEVGWGSIIYLAALTSIDAELYEASFLDGANRWKQTLYITLPGILPTIVILLILNIGRLMSVGFEKVFLLYNPLTYETADVISTFVYRRGLVDFDHSFGSAVGLFNTLINFTLLILANWLSRKVNETSLW